ncbi:uncharacterized protein LOC132917882 [Rhopalosiphum padi]|uniref:uncharacterized protein LOC132917882 n=1 Tax=Rhopalosiphum padi TaxID=40932 RepID=UPI00298E65F8|nr:uncharacterized protein LOC132917882 [Rhopalosiphum padi]
MQPPPKFFSSCATGSGYVFNINELPKRCDILIVGQFALDRDVGVLVDVEDESTIKILTEANKNVYLSIGFIFHEDWCSILNALDENEYKTRIFDPLVGFLNKYKLGGLFMCIPDMLNGAIENVSQKINDFVTSVKNNVDGLKVGLAFYVTDQISNKTSIDFTLINEIMDHYIIDFTNLNSCNNNTKKYGLNPICSDTMPSIEQITGVVTNSNMDQSKLFAKLQANVIIPEDLVSKDEITVTTYSKYCDDSVDTSRWCGNPSKLSYDQGAYVAQFYSGLYIENLDADDFECKCGCKKFPVTNFIIDGWTNSDFTACPKIDSIKPK